MKEIVVGIDFSRSSILAFEYAMKVAASCGCDLKLIYVCKNRDKENMLIRDEKGIESTINSSFQKLIDENTHKIHGRITFKVLRGKIYEEISNQAKYTNAEMIITGAHGMSGFEELWVGNNAMKIIANSEKPVLSVKKNFKVKTPVIEKIILPIDGSPETMKKVPFTLKLASYFKAQINVLSLYGVKNRPHEIESVDVSTKAAVEILVNSSIRYIAEKKTTDNLAKAIIEYAIKRNADLITLMNNMDYTSGGQGMSTFAQQTINTSPVPVLSFRANFQG